MGAEDCSVDQIVVSPERGAANGAARRRRALSLRPALLLVHRWAGLVIAAFLVVAGLTGTVLPFATELNHALAPQVWKVTPPTPGARPISGVELMHRVETQTGGMVRYVPLQLDPNFAEAVFVGSRPGGPKLAYNEVFADPYTGEIRQTVKYGRLSDGPVNIVPFIIAFHFSFAAGPLGIWLFGAASLAWVFVSLIGVYLTLPTRSGRQPTRPWVRRWAPAWTVRRSDGAHAFVFDLHRAGGLWLWLAMLVFAWSGVAFNLPQAHDPVQRLLGGRGLYTAPQNPDPGEGTVMSPEAAVERGRALMAQQARERGFTVEYDYALSLNPQAHAIGYYARTSLDRPVEEQGSTLVWFDAVDGRLLEFKPPFGKTPADTFDKWVRVLHMADAFGLPYRLLVSVFGLLTAVLSALGVVLWSRRQIRRLS
jgi:uncharacterized iron-regulated membrane protein